MSAGKIIGIIVTTTACLALLIAFTVEYGWWSAKRKVSEAAGEVRQANAPKVRLGMSRDGVGRVLNTDGAIESEHTSGKSKVVVLRYMLPAGDTLVTYQDDIVIRVASAK